MLSFSFPLSDRSPRDERKKQWKRDIGSRHGEAFVSILSIPSLSRNPNFHHSPTYRQIKAGWRGGFPQLRWLVTSLHKGRAAQSSGVRGGWSTDFKSLWIGTHWWASCSKGNFHRDWSETWPGISGLRVWMRTVTQDMRNKFPNIPQKQKQRCWLCTPSPCFSLGWISRSLLLRLFCVCGGWCIDGDVQVQGMPGLAADVFNTAAWH